MKNTLILLFCLLMLFSSFSTDTNSSQSFFDLLEKTKMEFKMPESFIVGSTIENNQMNYEYVIKNQVKKFEVRYAIRPLGSMIENYKEKLKNKQPGDYLTDPNKYYSASFQAITFNISEGKNAGRQEFDKNAVQSEFNADWGAMTFVETGKSFSQGYKYCMMVAIHKDDCADAYIFFMADDKEKIMELAFPAFHSLKFK